MALVLLINHNSVFSQQVAQPTAFEKARQKTKQYWNWVRQNKRKVAAGAIAAGAVGLGGAVAIGAARQQNLSKRNELNDQQSNKLVTLLFKKYNLSLEDQYKRELFLNLYLKRWRSISDIIQNDEWDPIAEVKKNNNFKDALREVLKMIYPSKTRDPEEFIRLYLQKHV